MKIGFIGLGNVGGKLAKSLLRNNFDLTVRDLDESLTDTLKDLGAKVAKSPKELAEQTDLIITSLPSPEVSAEVMEADDGIINGLSKNSIDADLAISTRWFKFGRDLFLVSSLQIGGEPWAEVLVSEHNDLASIEIAKARGFKCERCWHYEIEMSKNKQHPNICKRCEKVVLGI